jgi:outer membrane lipoprotein-sorting protein
MPGLTVRGGYVGVGSPGPGTNAPTVLTRSGIVDIRIVYGTATTVTARDPRRPEYGTIEMKFTDDPVELRQWIVTDDTGQQTTVILGDLEKDGRVPDILFNIQREMRNWGN